MKWRGLDLSKYPFFPCIQEVLDAKCRARKTDPYTSHEAAKKASKSFSTKVQRGLVLWGVRQWPGRTALELHGNLRARCPAVVKLFGGELTGTFVQRRMKDLRDYGLVQIAGDKKCRVTGSMCLTYRQIPQQMQLF